MDISPDTSVFNRKILVKCGRLAAGEGVDVTSDYATFDESPTTHETLS
jgi:hypothetical protein